MANSRETAMLVLYDVLKNGSYISIALNNSLKKSNLKGAERGFVTELAYGTLRNIIYIDYIIRIFSNVRLNKISDYILQILRISVYQIAFLHNIPSSAVCNEAVKIAKKYGHKASVGFVNAILRKISAEYKNIEMPKDNNEYLSVKFSMPQWITDKLIADFGIDFTKAFLNSTIENQKVTLRVNTFKTNLDEVAKMLDEEKIEYKTGRFGGVIINKGGSVEKLSVFKKGLVTVQDESSQLVALALAPKENETILDLCSAPGGKTTHIGELMKNKGNIIACDIHEHKLEFISSAAKRLGITIIKPRVNDAQVFNSEFENRFNRVLCDVPCSGLGLIAKKPDLKYNKTQDDLNALVSVQRDILNNGARYVKKGGILVYSTCTINRDENINQITEFLNTNSGFKLETIDAGIENSGYLELYPHINQTDGFFIAKLKRIY